MKLTTQQIKKIYLYISCGYSQRATAKYTKHTRKTIAHYIKPEVMATEYLDMSWDIVKSRIEKDYEIEKLKIDKNSYKSISIIFGLGLLVNIIINFFY